MARLQLPEMPIWSIALPVKVFVCLLVLVSPRSVLGQNQGPQPQFENQDYGHVLAVGAHRYGADTVATHTLALKIDGSLWAWGQNDLGQLGDGTTSNRVEPVFISEEDWTSVAAGRSHSVGLKRDGSLWSWGGGQTRPQRVGFENDWAFVSAGWDFTVALKRDGSLWGWGNNEFFQLGTETSEQFVTAPVRTGTDTDWDSVNAGQANTVAVKSDGSLWTWGGLDFNRVGKKPVSIGTDHDWKRGWAGHSVHDPILRG